MKVLIVCDVLFPQTVGGAGRVARELGVALMSTGHEVHFLTRQTGKGLRGNDVSTSYYPAVGKTFPGLYRRIFSKTVSIFQPDIVHVHQPLPAFLSVPSNLSTPIVYTFHSSWPEEFRIKSSRWPQWLRMICTPVMKVIERGIINHAAAVTVLSDFSRRNVKRLYERDSIVIPGGVDTKRFLPVKTARSDGKLRLITLRNLVPRMGLSELIRAMKLLRHDAQLEIGGLGPLRPELEKLTISLQLTDKISFIGHVQEVDLPRFYSSADWFILPTVALEGFGLVILESLSCGTPVVGTRVGAIPELLERFSPEWLIQEPTAREIASTISSVCQKPCQSPERLHNKVKVEFDWREIVVRYVEVFNNLIS